MPRTYRSMRKDSEGKPVVESSAQGLGVRTGDNPSGISDVEVGDSGNVLLNGKGMSVAPNWRALPHHRRPTRLQGLSLGSRGSNALFCFARGQGAFVSAVLNDDLALVADSETHGNIVPRTSASLAAFQESLAKTRNEWEVDEE